MKYNWQQADWPNFRYNPQELEPLILEFSEKIGRIGGLLDALPDGILTDTLIGIMVSEAIKTSEIEGEYLRRPDVMSSLRNNLGLFSGVQDRLNERQLKVLRRMLKEGPAGFKGGMTAKKYIAMTGAAKATATRDLQGLVQANVFIPSGGGRSVCYQVNL